MTVFFGIWLITYICLKITHTDMYIYLSGALDHYSRSCLVSLNKALKPFSQLWEPNCQEFSWTVYIILSKWNQMDEDVHLIVKNNQRETERIFSNCVFLLRWKNIIIFVPCVYYWSGRVLQNAMCSNHAAVVWIYTSISTSLVIISVVSPPYITNFCTDYLSHRVCTTSEVEDDNVPDKLLRRNLRSARGSKQWPLLF